MGQIYLGTDQSGTDAIAVYDGNPFPVKVIGNATVVGRTFTVGPITIPGVDTNVHAADEALGIKFSIGVPGSGVIESAVLYDFDKESLATDMILFNDEFTTGTDNSAFDCADEDLTKIVAAIQFGTFFAFSDNSVGVARGLGLAYVAPKRRLWVQMVTRDAPNLTAATDYRVSLTILADAD